MARKQPDGLEGYFASISMQDGSQIKCRLKKWVVSDLQVCINCSLVPSTLYSLQCSHKLCQACFNKHACYLCSMDKTRSQQYETSPFCTFNSGLLKTTMECPFCGTLHKFSKLQEHLKIRHPEIAPMMQPSRPESKQAMEPNAIRPPPGFPGHVSPIGRGRGLLLNDVNAYPRGYEECDHQVLNSKEVASFSTGPENMEIEETPQETNQPAGAESPEREDQPTTGPLCTYCAVFVKSDEKKEHLKYCLGLFLEWKELILNKVFHDCQESELDWNSKSFSHIFICPILDLECQRSFVIMMYNSREHCSDECPASKPGRSYFLKHVSNCPTFSTKCSESLNRVVGKYRRDHSSNGCPEAQKTTGILEAEVVQCSTPQASAPHGKTEQDSEDTDLCPNCFALLKIEDVADHADNCPKLVVCKKCSNRVVAKDYVKHLDDQCPANKQTCTSSQVDEDKDQISTKPASDGAQCRAHDFEEGAFPCPYCQTPWENKDLQEHMKNCQRDRFEALNSPSGKMNGYQPVNALLQESKPDTRSIKETKEDHAKPKETEDDVEALKKRVEHRRPILRVNKGLTTTVVQCPECSDNFVYEEFKRHMDNTHSGFRDVIGVRPYQEKQKKCGEVPEIPTEPACRGNEPLGDGTDRGCPNCPQCQDLWDKKDLQKAGADSAVETTEEDDINMLKITLQQLEKRVEALELPLRRLIERLRKDV